MSKEIESSLFMVSPLALNQARFYQQLFSGIATYEELANRLLKEIRAAYAFRQVESVRELSRLLLNIPVKEYQLIAQYYLIWCQCRELKFHDKVLDNIIEQTETYKAKALISRAAFEVYKGNVESSLYFYAEALKANPTVSDYIVASRGIATVKSMEGYHAAALKDLEGLIPLLRYAEPLTHYEVINSYAVESLENNRLEEAYNASLLAVSSPFGIYYPEWQQTHSEASQQAHRGRSTVFLSPARKLSNVVQASA